MGTVELAKPDGPPTELMFQEQVVRIRVDEAFKGVSIGQRIELHEAASDCAAKFRTGERHVFYMSRGSDGDWFVAPCTHSLGDPDPDGDDLLFLRGLPKSAAGTRLSGAVEYYQELPTESFKRVGGIPDIEVRIVSVEPFPKERRAKTNGAGVYELYGLPPGTYTIGIGIPIAKRLKFPVVTGSQPAGDKATVRLAPEGSASVSFVLEDDTRISGRILDGMGAPVKGVCLDLEPIEGRIRGGARFFDCSKANGEYKMEMMPPGKYLLAGQDEVRLNGVRSKSTLYYPGVRSKDQATVLSVEAGKYVEHLDMRLLSGEKRFLLAGRVQFEDGAPASNAVITFSSPENGYSETTTASPNGAFGLSAVAGMKGKLTGYVQILEPVLEGCPQYAVASRAGGMVRHLEAKPLTLTADSDHYGLNLSLPVRSCKPSPSGRN